METLTFLAIMGFFGFVLFWYILNTKSDKAGLLGLLAFREDENDIPQTSSNQNNPHTIKKVQLNARYAPENIEQTKNLRFKTKEKSNNNSIGTHKNSTSLEDDEAYEAPTRALKYRTKKNVRNFRSANDQ